MIYRGYNIRTVDAIDLQRHNYNEHKTDFCDGVYIELYDQADDGLTERIGDTTFAVGYEIPDLREETVEKAIREYVDDHILGLDCVRNEVIAERKNHLVGRLVSWIGEEQSGAELYNTLSEYIGMNDEEIRQCGFKSLVPCFDREAYAQTLERFGVNLSEDTEMVDMITEELYKKADILSEIGVYCDEFDLTFYLNYCPYVDKEEFEDVAYDQQI